MRVGYPVKNLTLGEYGIGECRVISFNPKHQRAIVDANLQKLIRILEWNSEHELLFYRLPVDLIPNASSPRNRLKWEAEFMEPLQRIGSEVKRNEMRISMHVDLYTAINVEDRRIVGDSLRELDYCARLLDLMELDTTAKIQIHVGSPHEGKDRSINIFKEQFARLDPSVQRRLVVENDCVGFTLSDCLDIHNETGVPVVFDVLHHQVCPDGASFQEALRLAAGTWGPDDGLLMVDYSSQDPGRMPGKHVKSIDLADFREFLEKSRPMDFDLMLEIKDMERSALLALDLLREDDRFVGAAGNNYSKSS